MIRVTDKSQCTGCGACANICPQKCIAMEADAEGFLYPEVNEDMCLQCEICIAACPVIAAGEAEQPDRTKAYAAKHTDEAIRKESSSGGVFSALAEVFLQEGGVVVGAAFTSDWRSVRHFAVEKTENLWKLRGSKYLQSEIGMTYQDVKYWLLQGRKVFFTGTPCQVEGLRSYLGKEWENLLCADLICHGVPSANVWERYLAWQEKNYDGATSHVSFRDKKEGWRNYAVRISFSNEISHTTRGSEDLYIRAFLRDICLRPSCYNCPFKDIRRKADLTMADFWGIKQIAPELDDDRGTSLVLVHTIKGQHVLEQAANRLTLKAVPLEAAIQGNPAAIKSADCPWQRDQFFDNLKKQPIDILIRAQTKDVWTAKRILAAILKRLGLWPLVQKMRNR